MANEILPAGIGDLTTNEVLATEFLYLLAASGDSILNHPALMHVTGQGRSSTVIQVPHIGLRGTNILSATTPGSEVANTALTDGSTDVTVAMYALRYEVDDLAAYIAGGMLDASMFAQSQVVSVAQTLVNLIANVADDFTATAGATTVDASWANVLDAKGQLAVANASGPLCAILHPQQWNDLEVAAVSLGVLPAQTMGGVINEGLQEYKGRWLGIDIFTSTRVPTANAAADRAGAIFTRGAIAWADAQMPDQGDPNILNMGRGQFERVRRGTFLDTAWMLSGVMGVSQAIDAAGVSLITDA